MTHADKGHYARKHPPGTTLDRALGDTIRSRLIDGRVSCAAAHAIAESHRVAPKDVGMALDLLEARIHQCQLGLFGHDSAQTQTEAPGAIDPSVESALSQAADEQRITCLRCWQIADRFDLPRHRIGEACEALGLKVVRCQLGAFA